MIGTLTNLSKARDSGFRQQANGVEVAFENYPTIGERFVCFGEGVEFGTRLVSTSPVVSMSIKGGVIEFHTESGSIYTLVRKEEREG